MGIADADDAPGSWPRPTAICWRKLLPDSSAKTCWYRLVLHILLRERREDILPLARHLLACCRRLSHATVMLAPDAEARLQARDWPGNV